MLICLSLDLHPHLAKANSIFFGDLEKGICALVIRNKLRIGLCNDDSGTMFSVYAYIIIYMHVSASHEGFFQEETETASLPLFLVARHLRLGRNRFDAERHKKKIGSEARATPGD